VVHIVRIRALFVCQQIQSVPALLPFALVIHVDVRRQVNDLLALEKLLLSRPDPTRPDWEVKCKHKPIWLHSIF